MDNIKPISIFISYESQKWYTVFKEPFYSPLTASH